MRRVRSFLPPAPPVGVSPCGLVWIAALKEMLRPASGTSHESQVAAKNPRPRQSPRQPLHFVPAVVTGFACRPDPEEMFGDTRGP